MFLRILLIIVYKKEVNKLRDVIAFGTCMRDIFDCQCK